MIQDGDRILIGLSGGKDSLTLAWILAERMRRVPIRYEIHGVYIDPGFDNGFSRGLETYCRNAGLPIEVLVTDIGVQAHSAANRENPCFLCAWNRRKHLFETADRLKCTKIALGHHKDDIIETLFMNIFYAGVIDSMTPRQPFFDGLFTVIRPLALVEEKLIERFAKERHFPAFVNPCPSSQHSTRSQIKHMLGRLYRSNSKIKGNIFHAIDHFRRSDLPG
jgi:tRNA 2-thiocytidine biosynthesis protein TtcA